MGRAEPIDGLIEQINHKIQISGKCHPQNIGDIEIGGRFVKYAEFKNHL